MTDKKPLSSINSKTLHYEHPGRNLGKTHSMKEKPPRSMILHSTTTSRSDPIDRLLYAFLMTMATITGSLLVIAMVALILFSIYCFWLMIFVYLAIIVLTIIFYKLDLEGGEEY